MSDSTIVLKDSKSVIRYWSFKEGKYGCGECCNKDRCDEDCDLIYRPRCPYCKGTGWIPENETEPKI